ncbi:MAG: hypothetical protein ACI9YU_002288, partial [Flavobacteriales bacterium]
LVLFFLSRMNSQFINKYWWLVLVGIPLLSTILHWNVFDKDLQGVHLWRQAQTQTVIENFATEGRDILNPKLNNLHYSDGIIRLEFPLMQWTYSWLYEDSGGSVAASRWASLCFGLLSVFGIFSLFLGFGFSKLTSALVAWCFNWSPLFYYYTLNPLPDNMALMFSMIGLAVLAHSYRKNRLSYFVLFQFLIGIASLIKLPYILFSLGSVPFLYQQLQQKQFGILFRAMLQFVVLLLPCLSWYVWVIPTWGGAGPLQGVSADNGFTVMDALLIIWQTLISIIPELIVNYAALPFLLVGIYRFWIKRKILSQLHLSLLLILLAFIAYYLYEINIISTVHDYYLFPFLPFLFIAVGYGLQKMLSGKKPIRLLATGLLLVLPITAYLRSDSRWRHMGDEKMLRSNLVELRAASPKNALCVMGNDVSTQIFLYTINRKGWTFSYDELSATDLHRMVDKGAEYFYSTSLEVENNPSIRPYLKELILDTGEMRVYKLAKPQ